MKCPTRLDSRFVAVLAVHNDRNTVNAAARCLNVSVSCPLDPAEQLPPPAISNNFLKIAMEANVFPEPLAPDTIMACGYPDSPCILTASCTTRPSSGQLEVASLVEVNVSGLPTSRYGFTDNTIGPTFV